MAVIAAGVPCRLREVFYPEVLLLTANTGRNVQLILAPADEEGVETFKLYSAASTGEWTLHARGLLHRQAVSSPAGPIEPLQVVRSRMQPQSVEALYAAFAEAGLHLGPSFRALQTLSVGAAEALGEFRWPSALTECGNDDPIHPVLLDASMQLAAALGDPTEAHELYLPFEYGELWFSSALPSHFYCHARIRGGTANDAQTRTIALRLLYDAGKLLRAWQAFVVKHSS